MERPTWAAAVDRDKASTMPTFIDFRDGRGGDTCRDLGVDISNVETWAAYTDVILSLPDRRGFVEAALALADRSSPTERVIIAAVLFAANLSSAAGQLDDGDFWRRAGNFSGDTAMAVAAAILRQDRQAAAQPALRVV